MRITCSVFFVIVVLVIGVPIIAGPSTFAVETNACPPALSRGAQALQFAIGSDFALNSFQGITLSYERFLRDRLALRLGIDVSTDYREDEETNQFEGETAGQKSFGLANWSHEYSLLCQLASYRGGPIGFCYGVGPKVTYSNYQHQDAYVYGSNGVIRTQRSSNWDRVWGVGMAGFAGVHWLVTDRLRLHAEYSTSAMYQHVDIKNINVYSGEYYRVETVKVERDIFGIYPGGTRLGLSVFF